MSRKKVLSHVLKRKKKCINLKVKSLRKFGKALNSVLLLLHHAMHQHPKQLAAVSCPSKLRAAVCRHVAAAALFSSSSSSTTSNIYRVRKDNNTKSQLINNGLVLLFTDNVA